jgi:histidine ammonia-lyase
MSTAIGRVLSAAREAAPADAWVKATELLADERAAIEQMLYDDPDLRVYGFNTLLGQLDNVEAVESNQHLLLQAHLIGRTVPITGVLPDLILSTKLEQLSHGGSGLHPETYQAVLGGYLGPDAEVLGAWSDSYSSGDVVPAAWWIQHLQTSRPELRLRSGDLIALLNGNFISTAFALRASVRLLDYLARFLGKAIEIVQSGRVGVLAERGEWLAELIAADLPVDSHLLRAGANLQAPVSMRDMASYVSPIGTVVDALRDAVDRRLSTFSGNPTFSSSGGQMRHASQASFLDLNLSMALTSAIQLTHFCMGAVQRFVQHVCDTRKGRLPLDYMRFVQPPKIASALLVEADTKHGTLPAKFQLAESEGIEDQADLSLSIAQSLAELVYLANDQLAILDNVFAMMGRTTPDRGSYYGQAFLARFAGPDHAAAHPLTAD